MVAIVTAFVRRLTSLLCVCAERHESEAKHKSVSNKEHRDVGWALLKKWYPRLKHAYGALPQVMDTHTHTHTHTALSEPKRS